MFSFGVILYWTWAYTIICSWKKHFLPLTSTNWKKQLLPDFCYNHLPVRTYGCFLKWCYPQNTPKWSVLVGKPHGCWVPPFKETPICKHTHTHTYTHLPSFLKFAVEMCWKNMISIYRIPELEVMNFQTFRNIIGGREVSHGFFYCPPPLKSVSYNPSSFRFWQKSVKIMSAASFPPSQNSTFGRFGSSCCWTACCSIHSRLGFSRAACGVSANNKLQVANFRQFQIANSKAFFCGSQLHRFFIFLVRFFCTGSFCNFRKCLRLYLENSRLLRRLNMLLASHKVVLGKRWGGWFLVICQKYGDAVSLKGGRRSGHKGW